MAYTPGPWDAKNWRVCADITGNIKVICDTANNAKSRTEENQANARLIAAAPDLLAACVALIDAPHYEHLAARLNRVEMRAIDMIRAAIRKASHQ